MLRHQANASVWGTRYLKIRRGYKHAWPMPQRFGHGLTRINVPVFAEVSKISRFKLSQAFASGSVTP